MTIGDKIKRIRTFRKMTQAELGAALGWGDKGANRLAQYETNYRVPKQDLITEMAKILDVNPWTLYDATEMNASEFMELLFWIDEFNPSAINLFQMETYPGEKCNSSEDTAVRYHDNDNWPAHPPMGLWINYGLVNEFMKAILKFILFLIFKQGKSTVKPVSKRFFSAFLRVILLNFAYLHV